jgi:class 3 adenylate cyclase
MAAMFAPSRADIVGSTERAGELGDRRWRELLNVHDQLSASWSRSSAAWPCTSRLG